MMMKKVLFFLVLAALLGPARARAADEKPPAPLPTSNDYEKAQKPLLEISSTTTCHLSDAKPLLLKARYNVIQYQRRVLSEKPLVFQEKLRLGPDWAMSVESRGCEDVYAKFDFFVKDATSTAKQWLDPAAEALRNLHLNPDSLIDARAVASIANAVANEANATHETLEFGPVFVCLARGKKECISDASIVLKDGKLTVFYVDRP